MANATKKNGSVTHHALSSRLLELSAETNDPQPYPVTDTIVVQPPTRTRRKAMYDADMRMYLNRQMLAAAIAAAAEAAPELPTEDATDEQIAEHAAALALWEKHTTAAKNRAEQITEQVQVANDDYDRAFFGDAYESVIEYFENKPHVWDLFIPDIKSEFLPRAPKDGKCPECGQIVDGEQAGKALESST